MLAYLLDRGNLGEIFRSGFTGHQGRVEGVAL
jgi:hypothetical protein